MSLKWHTNRRKANRKGQYPSPANAVMPPGVAMPPASVTLPPTSVATPFTGVAASPIFEKFAVARLFNNWRLASRSCWRLVQSVNWAWIWTNWRFRASVDPVATRNRLRKPHTSFTLDISTIIIETMENKRSCFRNSTKRWYLRSGAHRTQSMGTIIKNGGRGKRHLLMSETMKFTSN